MLANHTGGHHVPLPTHTRDDEVVWISREDSRSHDPYVSSFRIASCGQMSAHTRHNRHRSPRRCELLVPLRPRPTPGTRRCGCTADCSRSSRPRMPPCRLAFHRVFLAFLSGLRAHSCLRIRTFAPRSSSMRSFSVVPGLVSDRTGHTPRRGRPTILQMASISTAGALSVIALILRPGCG